MGSKKLPFLLSSVRRNLPATTGAEVHRPSAIRILLPHLSQPNKPCRLRRSFEKFPSICNNLWLSVSLRDVALCLFWLSVSLRHVGRVTHGNATGSEGRFRSSFGGTSSGQESLFARRRREVQGGFGRLRHPRKSGKTVSL